MNHIFVNSKSEDNKLILRVDKTNVIKFGTNSKTRINLNIGYDSKNIFILFCCGEILSVTQLIKGRQFVLSYLRVQ
jgi:hypothetical protein